MRVWWAGGTTAGFLVNDARDHAKTATRNARTIHFKSFFPD
jgi:hypothetical protein